MNSRSRTQASHGYAVKDVPAVGKKKIDEAIGRYWLTNRTELQNIIRKLYNEHKAEGRTLDYEGLLMVSCGLVERGCPREAFCNLEKLYVCFDYNGNGWLDMTETYKLMVRCLSDYENTSSTNLDALVPTRTPADSLYKQLEVLKTGSQGVATLIRDRYKNTLVLKSYDKQDGKANLHDLVEEAEHMKEVGLCPHLAHLIDIFQDDEKFYFVTEYYSGGDWTCVRKKASDAGVDTNSSWFRNLFRQAFIGVSFLHSKAITHCDLTEGNLMLKQPDYENPQVVIIDLGESQAFATHEEGICGTLGYIPPETLLSTMWIPKGDLYSMSIVCFQLMTDQSGDATGDNPPYCRRGTEVEIKERTKTLELPLEGVLPNAPDRDLALDLLVAISKKNPSERFGSTAVLAMPWFSQ